MSLKIRDNKEGKEKRVGKEAGRDEYMEEEGVSLFASAATKLRLKCVITVLL